MAQRPRFLAEKADEAQAMIENRKDELMIPKDLFESR